MILEPQTLSPPRSIDSAQITAAGFNLVLPHDLSTNFLIGIPNAIDPCSLLDKLNSLPWINEDDSSVAGPSPPSVACAIAPPAKSIPPSLWL